VVLVEVDRAARGINNLERKPPRAGIRAMDHLYKEFAVTGGAGDAKRLYGPPAQLAADITTFGGTPPVPSVFQGVIGLIIKVAVEVAGLRLEKNPLGADNVLDA
jgi:hypothetical protein